MPVFFSSILFDLAVTGFVLLTFFTGYRHGFFQDAIVAFNCVVAFIAMDYFTPIVDELPARLIALFLIFALSFAICMASNEFIIIKLNKLPIEKLNSALGLAFGWTQAFVTLGLGFLIYTQAVKPENQAGFIKNAMTRPLLQTSADWLRPVVPLDTILGIHKDSDWIKPTHTNTSQANHPQEKQEQVEETNS